MPILIGWCFCQFVCTCGRCCHIFLWQMLLPLMYVTVADVIAIIHCWLMLLPFYVLLIVWQMLLPLWLVVLPFDSLMWFMWQMLFAKVADGIVYQGGCGLWSDVIAISGRWNSDSVTCFISDLVLDCCTEPHPICGADGICLCSWSGMDYWPLYIGLLLWF